MYMKDCVEALAQKRGIYKSEAQSIMEDVVDIIVDACVNEGGVSFRNKFTIEKRVRKGRTGTTANGQSYRTEDKNTLVIKVGKELSEALNK